MKSSLASRRENWVFEMFIFCMDVNQIMFVSISAVGKVYTFLMVLFIAPVTPELHDEPKLIQEISKTAINLAISGGGCFPSPLSSVCWSWAGDEGLTGSSTVAVAIGFSDASMVYSSFFQLGCGPPLESTANATPIMLGT